MTTGAAHAVVNALPHDEARAALERCCGSSRWVAGMLARRPFASSDALHAAAAEIWGALGPDDFLEAFSHHPQIGEKIGEKVGEKTADKGAATWSAEEQARAAGGPAESAAALRALNHAYAARFGYIFITCATGKSAQQILTELGARLGNDPAAELRVAAAEQARITHLRLEKLAR